MWSVFFVFLSYLDRNFVKGEFLNYALDAEKENKEMFSMLNGTFCAKMSVIGENSLYQVSDGIEEVRSVHNPAGKLVDCSVIVDQMQVKSFMHVCRLGLKNQETKQDAEMHFAHVGEVKSACRELNRRPERTGTTKRMATTVNQLEDERKSSDSGDTVLKRSKRGFTYPGTLWCGAGNMADHYDHLGKYAETDSCCRVHDHCPYVIHAFSTKYGYTNFKWHSLCHCDCDNALKDCLRKVNDTSSRVVGQAFFNVMEVPCFEFAYEEQCAERHWYGVCKRYEKLPSAVIRESVPYDFGGIDVIGVDAQAVTPPSQTDSEKAGDKQEKPEHTTQSTVSGSQASNSPEEPSLRNVVTAAEDFIKVLATVSTSQSSNTDTAKGETQASEKKRRKNTGKKKKTCKARKRKGKGRKRKQRVDTGTKVEEGATVTPTGSKAEEVIGKSNFISQTGKDGQLSRHADGFIDRTFDLGGKDQPSNDVMKDEPMIEERADVSTTSLAAVKKEQAARHIQALTESTATVLLSTPASTTPLTPPKTKKERTRKGKGRKRKSNITSSPTEVLLNIILKQKSLVGTTYAPSDISAAVTVSPTIIPTGQLEQQKLKGHTEKGPVRALVTNPIVIPKRKRHRSRDRGEGEERKTRRKIANATVGVTLENSTVENLKVVTSTGAPTITLIPVPERIEQQALHRPDIYEARASVPTIPVAITSTLRVFQTRRQRSKEKNGKKKRRGGKIAISVPNKSPLHNASGDVVVQSLTASEGIGLLNVPLTTTVISRPIGQIVLEEAENISEKGLVATVTVIPVATTKRLRPTGREGRKQNKKTMPSVVNDGVTIQSNTKTVREAMARFSEQFTGHEILTMPSKADKTGEFNLQTPESTEQASYSTSNITTTTTTRTPIMSRIQLSIQRAQEQFARKRRRKTALSIRPK